jgi:hypothetical protein
MAPLASLPSAGVATTIREQLLERGSAHAVIAELPVTVNEWRRLARAIGRELGRPVQTTAIGGIDVHAIFTD